jgi:metal-responsive CopG/Arc/MetJ family transcriptional regulator
MYDKGLPKGNKRQISLTIAPELLRQVDECAERAGIGRAAFISMAVFKAVKEATKE